MSLAACRAVRITNNAGLRKNVQRSLKPTSAYTARRSYTTVLNKNTVTKASVATKAPLRSKAGNRMQMRFYSNPWDGVDFEVLQMPALSPSMEKGNLISWEKQVGDEIQPSDIIAQVETDKATVAYEATDEGYMAKMLVEAGTKDIDVHTPVCVVVAEEEDIPKLANYTAGAGESAPAAEPAASEPSQPAEPAAPAPQAAEPPAPYTALDMPALSPSMSHGNLVSWSKKIGDPISAGDVIAEIETDKATVAFEATDDGFLAEILVQEGQEKISVGTPIGIMVDEEEHVPLMKGFKPTGDAPTQAVEAAPEPTKAAPAAAATGESTPAAAPASTGGRVTASPYARKLAQEKGFDIAAVKGTGPNGRIIAADILEFTPAAETKAPKKQQAPAATATETSAVHDGLSFKDIPVSNVRRVIADVLTTSKQTVPHYYLTVDFEVDKLMAVRKQLNDESKGEYKLSVNDFIVKAAALACKKVPEANSQWRGEVIRQFENVDINVAVAAPQGLLTPIVRGCEGRGLTSISVTTKDLAVKARDGKIHPQELEAGTFTISNLGMLGVKHFSAVILPPQACILAVGASSQKAVIDESGPEPALKNVSVMEVTLSCDHRVVDGAVGAQWLKVFKDLMENPIKMLL